MMRTLLLLGILTSLGLAQQTPPPPPPSSPEVQSDGRVTFRFKAPNAKEVMLAREGAKRVAMQKDEQGVWSITTDPMEPDYYGYSFIVDGTRVMDPVNPLIKSNLLNPESVVHIPGTPASAPWENADVPHGAVNHHFYRSTVIGDDRDFYVYTPPGYDPTARKQYPVLYLLHGYSDDASGWTTVGKANLILDNLIAQGKTQPMVIVMTLGYGAPEIVTRNRGALRDPGIAMRNYERYRDALFTEVMPQVEKSYRVSKDRQNRAIAGLSMGGAESLFTGLNAVDRFAYIGAFSAGGLPSDYDKIFPKLDAKANDQLRLLWIACGTEDGLIEANRKFEGWLKEKNVRFTPIETPGAHTWLVWRRNLATFAPLLFRSGS